VITRLHVSHIINRNLTPQNRILQYKQIYFNNS